MSHEDSLPWSSRRSFADHLTHVLGSASPGSRVELRGSIADGTDDEFSDIDLRWTVPRTALGTALGSAPSALGSVAPLLSLRVDPDDLASLERRLLFARFDGVPVWWRVDLEVVTDGPAPDAPEATAESSRRTVGTDGALHVSEQVVPWDPYESALNNALAAVKAVGRGRPDQASALLSRGEARITGEPPAGVPAGTEPTDPKAGQASPYGRAGLHERIVGLAELIAGRRPHLQGFAQQVRAVAAEVVLRAPRLDLGD